MSMYSEFTIIKSQVHAAVASKAIQGDRSVSFNESLIPLNHSTQCFTSLLVINSLLVSIDSIVLLFGCQYKTSIVFKIVHD